MFQHTADELQQAAQAALELAKQKGATAAEVDLSESLGQSVQVRWREIEQIEYQQDKSLDITVFVGHSKGRASTADLSPAALASTVQAACDIARYTAADPFAGIADASLMATHIADLDRYHEWDLSSENAIAIAKECEEAALSSDSRISNSEGASINTSHFQFVYANSHGFCQHQRGTRHSLSCSVVASDANGMERDYWYDIACDRQDLDTPAHIGNIAAERATRRLAPQSVATGSYPILFDATVANSLIGHIVGGLTGGALYRQSSFLQDSLGTQILPSFISLREEPHIPRALGSTYFDSEGVATQPRFVIENGIVRGYFLDSYSARKLKQTSTGNAGGAHNLYLTATAESQAQMLSQMGTGLLITELMGQGVNMLTGDYSRGAAGFWVENGIIRHPVSGITIAGSLKEMLRNIVATGSDFRRNASSKIGSILISNMTVAGA
ncbi:metalloprotease PmbA [Kingella oralis]|uniref:TldD/PmbA family protein n=1 Tax=Kingella oralis ATCC 51147 TaxID=629741 RepID=C4GGX9_9NEIS|nr:metalloprotease PmbA [Kingella oralis]EEP69484.1 TldD/PmbA family protein [Kingella oralis ATCC 51147]QMT43733.1 metalloprotease PmbA [Kingella oralis]